jgi:hypothetical protein
MFGGPFAWYRLFYARRSYLAKALESTGLPR